ncbi:MAG: phosphoribosylformylglycinamidine synthase I [Elusimicrobiota bacterium]
MKPKVIILRACGTNCDIETKNAFNLVGADAELVHINELITGMKKLCDYDIMALPGGFSFGDDISAGKIFALRIKSLRKDFDDFIRSKKPVIGICNGFQVLVKTGFLPYHSSLKQTATLYLNDVGHFVCKWVRVRVNPKSPCLWTKGISSEFYLPVAHGEGKFIADEKTIREIKSKNLNALSYIDNPNGSFSDIAGLTNENGNLFGLMPHPERTFFKIQLPWKETGQFSIGYEFFKNAVEYVK